MTDHELQMLERLELPGPVAETATILRHEELGGGNRKLVMKHSQIARIALPGQFVMVTVPAVGRSRFLLPRPMAIHRRRMEEGTFELIYKVVGGGTRSLAEVLPGSVLELIGPLGQPFRLAPGDTSVLLIGRGIGICAFMTVAEDALVQGSRVTAVLSARTAEAIIGKDDVIELGVQALEVDDVSGSSEVSVLERRLQAQFSTRYPDVIMVCGSARLEQMAVRLGKSWEVPVQVSVESHMACGMGYCHGCALPGPPDPAKEGALVCVDGPVFGASTVP